MDTPRRKLTCTKCGNYSFQLQHCRLGKINPKTIKGGVDAVRYMGLNYICSLAPLRHKIVERLMKENQRSL